MFTQSMSSFFDENGYVVARQLFSRQEVAALREHYMVLRARGSSPGDLVGVEATSNDPLKRYPRMIHMHHWDQTSLNWLLEPRLTEILTGLLGREPYAVQTMLYFKPAGARGQALHQDQYFLRARPGTCMAAWLALDGCDQANGCMQVVPGSHTWPLLCTTQADTKSSFTDVTVPLPKDQQIWPVVMQAGDVLFFNGTLVHGSYPNTTKDRFRRSLIGHYISGEAEQVSKFMKPILRMDGREVDLEASLPGGPCGVWIEEDGRAVIEMSGLEKQTGLRTE
jgi:phytanoyl-CoA hydroxylase